MTISKREIQTVMARKGYYKGDIDGDFGIKSKAAAGAVMEDFKSQLPRFRRTLTTDRIAVIALQLLLLNDGFDEVGKIDGFVGPSTEYALSLYQYEFVHGRRPSKDWRSDDFNPDNETGKVDVETWPRQSDIIRFFGQAGGPQCTAGKVDLPFSMRIAWDKESTIQSFSCHEEVAVPMERVYRSIASNYSPEDIIRHGFDLFGGCYNYRKKRGGNTLSTHAFGIAVDHDPERNQLRWNHDRANLARFEMTAFWEAWEAEGFLSLGRARDFDWMHVQAAKL